MSKGNIGRGDMVVDRGKGPGLGTPGAGALRVSVVVTPGQAGERLDKALAALAGDNMSRGLARKVIAMGAVYVGKRRVRAASRPVRAGDRLTATWHPEVLSPGPKFEIDEIYVDDHIVVVNKPAGQLVAGTELGDAGTLQHMLEKRYGPTTRLMHRLDKPASGLLVAARSKRASSVLTPQFRDHTIERRYIAVAAGEVPTGSVTLALAKDRRRMSLASSPDAVGAISARTDFEVVDAGEGWTLLLATLHTGRTHQIRLHAAGSGGALFGDRTYKGPSGPRLALHAAVIGFFTGDGTRQTHVCPPGDDFWEAANLAPRDVQDVLAASVVTSEVPSPEA